MTWVKICGVRSAEQAMMCVEAGADAIGLNFWPSSVRFCEPQVAVEVVRAVAGRAELVGVFVDASSAEIAAALRATGVRWAQLHGDERPSALETLLPYAYKALRVGTDSVLREVRRFGGKRILLDAASAGAKGGTGRTFDWELARAVARERSLILAGGLGPANVVRAVEAIRPYGVDVASGVESQPGVKDPAAVEAFVRAVRLADGI